MIAPSKIPQEEAPNAGPGSDPANDPRIAGNSALSARLEPFDSYWQAPKDIAAGYRSFFAYYKTNYLPHMPDNKDANATEVGKGLFI